MSKARDEKEGTWLEKMTRGRRQTTESEEQSKRERERTREKERER